MDHQPHQAAHQFDITMFPAPQEKAQLKNEGIAFLHLFFKKKQRGRQQMLRYNESSTAILIELRRSRVKAIESHRLTAIAKSQISISCEAKLKFCLALKGYQRAADAWMSSFIHSHDFISRTCPGFRLNINLVDFFSYPQKF